MGKVTKYDTQENGTSESISTSSKFQFLSKCFAVDSRTYVIHTAINSQPDALVAAALSDNTIKTFSALDLNHSIVLSGHHKPITGLKYSEEANILFSSSLDGNINTWDIRCSGNPVQTFSDTSDGTKKPISCFDFNADERALCGGTELIRQDSFLIFWDRRMTSCLGGYWNSHTDDITQVSFHPSSKSLMASGSTDGLINIFDLNSDCEDDALAQTLNTNSSVSILKWVNVGPTNFFDHLSCITHVEKYQLWHITEANPDSVYDREFFSKNLKCNVDYFINSFMLDGSIVLSSGSNDGSVTLWKLSENSQHTKIPLKHCHTDIVRTMSWSPQRNLLVSGGEDGMLCLWNYSTEEKMHF